MNIVEPYGSASINKLTGTINNEGRSLIGLMKCIRTHIYRPTEKDLNNFVSYKLINDDFSKIDINLKQLHTWVYIEIWIHYMNLKIKD